MPEIDAAGVVDPGLAAWMTNQRWFGGKGDDGALEVLGSYGLPAVGPGVRIVVLLVLHRALSPVLYQVPLTVRTGEAPTGAAIVERDDTTICDGPHDPAFAAALFAFLVDGGTADGAVAVHGVPFAVPYGALVASSKVLSGEQSNTSIILELADEEGAALPPAIVKVFRTVHHGENPDVVLQSAIAAAGSQRVPATLGALVGTWPDAGRVDGTATGHLAVAQEFLPGTEDAWRVAVRAASAGEDFTLQAADLGRATAEVHRVLAGSLPTADADDHARAALLASMRARAQLAEAVVPWLEGRADRIDTALAAGGAGAWPPLQRVHGDYHLGQVLLAPDRGWVLLDFEGEPLRPMTERNEPDVSLRDVAGMLRSFDYVAGAIVHQGGDADAAAAWTVAARDAFLAGYEAELGTSLEPYRGLIAALELDKALYECVYEARNRPDWLSIPETAVGRILERQA